MSITSSLHIWSSVKLPLSGFPTRNGKENNLRVPYVDNRINQDTHPESERKLVNLRVPSPLRRENENKTSVGIVYSPSDFGTQKRASRRRFQEIGRVTVPDILAFERANGFGEGYTCHGFEKEFIGDSNALLFSSEFDDGREFDWIPSVKPWTEEELKELNEKYALLEEEIKKESERKKRQRAHVRASEALCLDRYKSLEEYKHLNRKKEPTTIIKSSGQEYYETKLAELYMIQLGIKR